MLTPAEFAAEYRVHPVTVRALCRSGRLPGACRVGSRWRINRATYEAAQAARPGSPRRPAAAPRASWNPTDQAVFEVTGRRM